MKFLKKKREAFSIRLKVGRVYFFKLTLCENLGKNLDANFSIYSDRMHISQKVK